MILCFRTVSALALAATLLTIISPASAFAGQIQPPDLRTSREETIYNCASAFAQLRAVADFHPGIEKMMTPEEYSKLETMMNSMLTFVDSVCIPQRLYNRIDAEFFIKQ